MELTRAHSPALHMPLVGEKTPGIFSQLYAGNPPPPHASGIPLRWVWQAVAGCIILDVDAESDAADQMVQATGVRISGRHDAGHNARR